MYKILIPIILVGTLVAIFSFLRFNQSSSTETEIYKQATSSGSIRNKISQGGDTEVRLDILEKAVVEVLDRLDKLDSSDSELENRLKTLESKVDSLSKTTTAPTSIAPTQTTIQKAPIYIPLGASGSTGDKNFVSIASFEISLDPADFAGYTNVQLELSLKLSESAGLAYARLYNQTDQVASSAEVSTSSSQYVLLTTSGLKLSAGRKTYRLQLRSTEGYEATAQNARIKVNF